MIVDVESVLESEELRRLFEAAEERGRCASRSSRRCWSRWSSTSSSASSSTASSRSARSRSSPDDEAAARAASAGPGAARVDDRRAAALPARGGPASAADRRRGGRAREAGRARRPAREAADDPGEPPFGRLDREELPQPGPAVPRPDPGGHAGADPRRREVRLAPGVQVLDVCDLVDPPGGRALARRQVADHPDAGARRRARLQAQPRRAPALDGARPRADARGDRREANLTLAQAKEVRAAPKATSLDAPVGEDDDAVLGDFVSGGDPPPEELVEETIRAEAIASALRSLPQRHRDVLVLRYGLDHTDPRTLGEIGSAPRDHARARAPDRGRGARAPVGARGDAADLSLIRAHGWPPSRPRRAAPRTRSRAPSARSTAAAAMPATSPKRKSDTM